MDAALFLMVFIASEALVTIWRFTANPIRTVASEPVDVHTSVVRSLQCPFRSAP